MFGIFNKYLAMGRIMSLNADSIMRINNFYSGTYISCRKYLNDDIFAFDLTISGVTIVITIEQVAAKCKLYDAAGTGIAAGATVALQGSDTNEFLGPMAHWAFISFVFVFVKSWISNVALWTGRGFSDFPSISGLPIIDGVQLSFTTEASANSIWFMSYDNVIIVRNAYKTAWDTLMPRLMTFVNSNIRSANNLFQIVTEPTSTDVSLSPSVSMKGMQLIIPPLVQTLPVVVSGTSNICGGIVVSDGGRQLTGRGIAYCVNREFNTLWGQTSVAPAGAYSWSAWRGRFSGTLTDSNSKVPGSVTPANPSGTPLTPGSKYWARAYVTYTNAGSTVYSWGNSLEFTYVRAPTVTLAAAISEVSSVIISGLNLNVTINNPVAVVPNGTQIIARGIIWTTNTVAVSPNITYGPPTNFPFATNIAYTGGTLLMNNVIRCTSYRVRGFVLDSGGNVYYSSTEITHKVNASDCPPDYYTSNSGFLLNQPISNTTTVELKSAADIGNANRIRQYTGLTAGWNFAHDKDLDSNVIYKMHPTTNILTKFTLAKGGTNATATTITTYNSGSATSLVGACYAPACMWPGGTGNGFGAFIIGGNSQNCIHVLEWETAAKERIRHSYKVTVNGSCRSTEVIPKQASGFTEHFGVYCMHSPRRIGSFTVNMNDRSWSNRNDTIYTADTNGPSSPNAMIYYPRGKQIFPSEPTGHTQDNRIGITDFNTIRLYVWTVTQDANRLVFNYQKNIDMGGDTLFTYHLSQNAYNAIA